MQDTLDLPAIQPELLDEAAPAPALKTAVAVAASQALDLAKIDLQDVALAQFGRWQDAVAEVRKKLDGTVHDLSTQTKIDEAKSLRWRLIGIPRAQARTITKELKSKLAKVSKAIGAEEERIVAAWDEAETLITPQIEAREKELEAEREAARIAKEKAAREEAERKQAMEDGIATIAGYVQKAQGKTAAQMAAGLAVVKGITIDPAHWREYTARASDMLASTIQTLEAMHAGQVKAEADAAELEALRREKAEREAREAAAAHAQAAATRFATALRGAQERVGLEAAGAALPEVHGRTEPFTTEEMERMADVLDGLQSPEPETPPPADAGGAPLAAVASAEAEPESQAGEAVNPGQEPEAAPSQAALIERGRQIVDDIIAAEVLRDVVAGSHADTRAATPTPEASPVRLSSMRGMARVIYAEPEPADPIDEALSEARDLAQHLRLAFSGKFPSHPKPDFAWWWDARAGLERLEAALAQAGGR